MGDSLFDRNRPVFQGLENLFPFRRLFVRAGLIPERLNHGVKLGTDGGVGNPQFLFHFLYIAPAADKRFCEIQLFVGEVIEFAEPEVIFNDCVAGTSSGLF